MAQYPVSTHFCFPTKADVNGGSLGQGKYAPESTLRNLWRVLGGYRGGILSGFNLPSSGSITQGVPGGVAAIGPYLVGGSGNISCQFDDNQTTVWVWLRLIKNIAGEIGSLVIETSTTPTVVPDAILLGRVGTSGGSVVNMDDARREGREIYGTVEFRSSGTAWRPVGGSGNWMASAGATNHFLVDWLPALARTPTLALAWKAPSGSVPTFLAVTYNSASQVDVNCGGAPSNNDQFHFLIRG